MESKGFEWERNDHERKALVSVLDVTDTLGKVKNSASGYIIPQGRSNQTKHGVLTSTDGLDRGILLQRDGNMKRLSFFFFFC